VRSQLKVRYPPSGGMSCLNSDDFAAIPQSFNTQTEQEQKRKQGNFLCERNITQANLIDILS
jgi:hypothetical protein